MRYVMTKIAMLIATVLFMFGCGNSKTEYISMHRDLVYVRSAYDGSTRHIFAHGKDMWAMYRSENDSCFGDRIPFEVGTAYNLYTVMSVVYDIDDDGNTISSEVGSRKVYKTC